MSALYWKNVSGDGAWENVLNWFTDAAATTQASNAPWVTNSYNDYDLTRATGESSHPEIIAHDGVYFGEDASWNQWTITGTADFDNFTFKQGSVIMGGNFTGDNFTNNGVINGGTFSGDNFTNNNNISGGTFSGAGFLNQGVIQRDGGSTFTGSGFVNGLLPNSMLPGRYFAGWAGLTYDQDGYDASGFNVDGWDIHGFDHYGYNSAGYNDQGFNSSGYNSSGYNQYGFNSSGHNQYGFNYDGYNADGLFAYDRQNLYTGDYNGNYYINGVQDSGLNSNGSGYSSVTSTLWYNGSDTQYNYGWNYNTNSVWNNGSNTNSSSAWDGTQWWYYGYTEGGLDSTGSGYCTSSYTVWNNAWNTGSSTGWDGSIYWVNGSATAWATPPSTPPIVKFDSEVALALLGSRVYLSYNSNILSKVIPQLDIMGTGIL